MYSKGHRVVTIFHSTTYALLLCPFTCNLDAKSAIG